METRIKRKEVLKEEAKEILKQYHPEAFRVIHTSIRVKGKQSDFHKQFTMWNIFHKYMLEKLWPTYIGYWHILSDSLNYDWIVNFQFLADVWVKEWMVKLCKRKFISEWFIKKHWWYFYANPAYVQKWEALNPNIIDLFK